MKIKNHDCGGLGRRQILGLVTVFLSPILGGCSEKRTEQNLRVMLYNDTNQQKMVLLKIRSEDKHILDQYVEMPAKKEGFDPNEEMVISMSDVSQGSKLELTVDVVNQDHHPQKTKFKLGCGSNKRGTTILASIIDNGNVNFYEARCSDEPQTLTPIYTSPNE